MKRKWEAIFNMLRRELSTAFSLVYDGWVIVWASQHLPGKFRWTKQLISHTHKKMMKTGRSSTKHMAQHRNTSTFSLVKARGDQISCNVWEGLAMNERTRRNSPNHPALLERLTNSGRSRGWCTKAVRFSPEESSGLTGTQSQMKWEHILSMSTWNMEIGWYVCKGDPNFAKLVISLFLPLE